MTVDDFNEAVGARLPQGEARMLAGLAFSALGRRPEPGDEVRVDAAAIRVEEMDGLRTTRIRVGLSDRPGGAAPDERP